MDCLLHIGIEKTGTSSLQAFLDLNRKNLTQQNFHFLESAGNKNNRKLAAMVMNEDREDDFFHQHRLNTRKKRINFFYKFKQEFEKELTELPPNIKTVIISSEHFHSRCIHLSEVVRLKSYLNRFFTSVTIVVYLRSQLSVARSLYSTALRNGLDVKDINNFILKRCKPKKKYFNYESLLERWGCVFNKENIKVFIYPQDIVSHFCKNVGIDSEALHIPERKNSEINELGQHILNRCNSYLKSKKKLSRNKAYADIKRLVELYCQGRGVQPTQTVVSKTESRFKELNQRLIKNWLPAESQNCLNYEIKL